VNPLYSKEKTLFRINQQVQRKKPQFLAAEKKKTCTQKKKRIKSDEEKNYL